MPSAESGSLEIDSLIATWTKSCSSSASPWITHHPKAIVSEFEDNKTVPLGHQAKDIAEFLERQGYAVIVSEWDPIVEYGTTHSWQRFVRYPATIPGGSWGNLLAVGQAAWQRCG